MGNRCPAQVRMVPAGLGLQRTNYKAGGQGQGPTTADAGRCRAWGWEQTGHAPVGTARDGGTRHQSLKEKGEVEASTGGWGAFKGREQASILTALYYHFHLSLRFPRGHECPVGQPPQPASLLGQRLEWRGPLWIVSSHRAWACMAGTGGHGCNCHLLCSSGEARLSTNLGGVSCRWHLMPQAQWGCLPQATGLLAGESELGRCPVASVPHALPSYVSLAFSPPD